MPVRNLLLIGDSKTVNMLPVPSSFYSAAADAVESPTRITGAGWSTDDVATAIDAQLAAAIGTPTHILINLGANDVTSMPTESNWKADMNYVLDALNAKYPGVPCYLMRSWRRTYNTECNTLAGWIADVVAGNTLAHLGPDERVFLEGGDDGATWTSDGVHPINPAGYQLTASEWLQIL